MNKNHIYIILYLCCNLLWARSTNSPLERGGEAGVCLAKTIIIISKDSLLPKEKDTTKLKKVDLNHLAYLQQIAATRQQNRPATSINITAATKSSEENKNLTKVRE